MRNRGRAFYGLPEQVLFCNECVFSNQRPLSTDEYRHTANSKKDTLQFNERGMCKACEQMHVFYNEIDWQQREEELIVLLDRHRKNGTTYDVLVPGSGGKDSIYAAHVLKYKYNMNPLTVTWSPHLYTEIGWQNFQNWIHVGGFDNYLHTPNGVIHRRLTQLSVNNLFHFFQPFIMGQKTLALKMAAKFDIDLIFYGEMPGQYGENISIRSGRKFGEVVNSKGYGLALATKSQFQKLYIGGVQVAELINEHGFKSSDLLPYMPAEPDDILSKGIEFYYLGYFLPWIPQEAYYYATEHSGFRANPERTEGTYSKYNSLDDRMDGFHYWSTFIKFGIGRATWDASQEIRNKHITRQEGKALVKRFDGEFPKKYFKDVLQYINMDEDAFFRLADKFRSPHLWKEDHGEWKLRHNVNQDGVDD